MTIRVMVVDDSALYRQLVKNVLRAMSDVEIVGLACTGKEALEKIPELKPDLLTLDVQMPDMNGLELLREIKQRRLAVKAIMLSSLTSQGAQVTTDALLAGAFDFIQKPNSPDASTNRTQLAELLLDKINAFGQSRNVTMPVRKKPPSSPNAAIAAPATQDILPTAVRDKEGPLKAKLPRDLSQVRADPSLMRIDALLIGTSTGGPIALRELIPKLPLNLGVPVLVVQHMPPKYTQSLASRIGEVSQLPVEEGADGMRIEANHVYLAPGGSHMGIELVRGKPVIRTSDDPHEHNCRPAVDYTFRSAASVYGGNLLAVILTGMGRDGTEGCRLIKKLGGAVLAQHPEGCIVYGMPKVVVEEQIADRVVPLEKMASWIVRMIEKSRSSTSAAPLNQEPNHISRETSN